MKILYKNLIFVFLAGVMAMGFQACEKADEDFQHDDNLIHDMRLKMNTTAEGIIGVRTEYNAEGVIVAKYDSKGKLLPEYKSVGDLTAKAVQGGHGEIEFILSRRLIGAYDLERCYLSASLTFDEVITPSLALHNITNRDENGVAQGTEFTVTSGIGTTRVYKVIGYFEGEYVYVPEPEEPETPAENE